mgnify:CR=1 FL=1
MGPLPGIPLGAPGIDAVYGDALGTIGVALVFGLVIMAMVHATGHLSGAHINPAVTLARSLTQTFAGIRPEDVAGFVVAQLIGMGAGCGVASLLGRTATPASNPDA